MFHADSDIPEGVKGEKDSGELLLGNDHLRLLDVPLRCGNLHTVCGEHKCMDDTVLGLKQKQSQKSHDMGDGTA